MSQTLAPPQSQSTSVLAQIGNTPLLKLERVAADLPGVELYAITCRVGPTGISPWALVPVAASDT